MFTFDRYKDAYLNAKLTRTPDGVLEVRFRTDGAKLVFNGHTHEQFTDMFHPIGEDPENLGVIVTGNDGVRLLWPEMIGSIRGRYFVLTQQKLDAVKAKSLGVVNEIVPAEQLLDRAHAIASNIAKQPPLTTRYTRIGLTQRLRRVIDKGIGYGPALEGITAAEVARMAAVQNTAA